MLKPAAMYKDILMEKFTSVLYTEDYYYYCGYPGTGLPEIVIEDGTYSYAIIDKNNNVIGFFTYQIFDLTDTVISLSGAQQKITLLSLCMINFVQNMTDLFIESMTLLVI